MIKKLNSTHLPEALILVTRILILMVLYTLSRILFYLFNLDHFSDMTLRRFWLIMMGGFRFDISAILFLNSLYIVLYLIPSPLRYNTIYQKSLKYLFFITNAIGLAANTIDFFYFDFILKRSTADVFHWAREGNIVQLFKQFFVDYFYGVLLWVAFVFMLVVAYNKTRINKPKPFLPKIFYPSGLLFMLLAMYLSVIGMRGSFVTMNRPITLGNAGKYIQRPLEMALVLNTPFTIIRTLDKQPLKEETYFPEDKIESLYTPVHKVHPAAKFNPLNVVIIVMESFGKEYSGALNPTLDNGAYIGYTPFLDSLMGQSRIFVNAFANGRKSIDALPSVVTSIPSMVQPYVTSKYATNRINGLADLLGKMGYETAFFHGAPNGSMGFDALMKMAGYKEYYGMTEYGNNKDFDGLWGLWDEPFFQFFAHKMNTLHEPFLSTIFSLSSHHPFKVPEKYKGKFRKGTLPIHAPVQYSDRSLKEFFATASTMPWFNHTLFVFTADHCNMAYHPFYKTITGNFSIPIFFYYPGGSKNFQGIDSTVINQIDIMPTVLDFLNYPYNYFAFGHNAFDSTADHFAVNYTNDTYQFIKGKYVLLFRKDQTRAIYNYRKDSLQKNNLVNKLPKIQLNMETEIKAFIQQYNNRMISNRLTVN